MRLFPAIPARHAALAALGGLWLCLSAATVAAETINDLTAEFETLVQIEASLLDQKSEIRARLEDPNLIWIERADGSASAVPRARVEHLVGTVYDWLVLFGADTRIIEALPPEKAAIARVLTFTGTARGAAIEKAITELQAQGAPLRKHELDRMNRIDGLLEEIRTWATETLARRDAMIRAQNTGAPLDVITPVCLDASVPADRFATYWALGYGGSRKYPVKGNYICRESATFDLISGNTLKKYRCDPATGTCEPVDDRSLSFVRDTDKTTGLSILRFEDGGILTYWPN
jgi:hypothetical protein